MDYPSIDDCVRFHGHLCGGVTLGYVMAKFAMEQISAGKEDALYCICEFQNCMTDAVQMVTGCTAGKGNLAVRPIGKRALTLIRKDTGKGVRVTAEFQFPSDVPKRFAGRKRSRFLSRKRQRQNTDTALCATRNIIPALA